MLYRPGPDEPLSVRVFDWALRHKIECLIIAMLSGSSIYKLYLVLVS
jgi:hypothetical protein